jgi:hypothetical protein
MTDLFACPPDRVGKIRSAPVSTGAGECFDNDSKQARRYSADAWNCLRGVIDREHRILAASDPCSPRIRPTLPVIRSRRGG